MDTHRGSLDRDDVSTSGRQTTIVHETGHGMGFQHPGQYLDPPAQAGEDEDYDPDPDSLMGYGMTLRPREANAAFCSQIDPQNGTDGKPCSYSGGAGKDVGQ